MDIKAELAKIVGGENISDDPQELRSLSADHSLEKARVASYVVRPRDTLDIQKVIQLSNEIKLPVVPSSSRIHFYGSALPLQGGIILDLSRMNRVIEIDERNRKVRIEPGVTWSQLQSELAKRHMMAIIPFLPHPLKSAMTGYLEREPVVIPKHEYGDPMLTMEFVYPNGKIMRTGSAIVPGATTKAVSDGVFPSGPGIDHWRLLQGAQGTMGVVTWANVKIEYLPQTNKVFFISFDRIEDTIEPLYKIQRHMLGLECFLLNRLNLGIILSQNSSADPNNFIETLPDWILVLVLGGGRRHPEIKIAYEEEALRDIAKEFSLTKILTNLPAYPGAERRLLAMLRGGWPAEKNYWKFALRGSCQDVFFLTRLEKVSVFFETLSHLLSTKHITDVGFYIQPIEYGRACHFECNIYYSQSDPKQVEAVRNLYMEAAELLLGLDALFTRPYGALADLVYEKATNYGATLKRLKTFYDPNNILAPGRLCFK